MADQRRRVQGLRREEVAALASISVDYYTRIEQGRRGAPWPTLDAIARALRLDEGGRAYLFELSAKEDRRPLNNVQKVSPHFGRLLGDLGETPAIILGRRMDVLAWNPLASALLTDFDALPARDRNYVRLVFTDPAFRELYPQWAQEARLCVARLHMEVSRDAKDPRMAELVGELSVMDHDFRRWWSEHHVVVKHHGVKEFRHPAVGDLTLGWDTLIGADDPDQQLISWTAEPNSVSAERLRKLANR